MVAREYAYYVPAKEAPSIPIAEHRLRKNGFLATGERIDRIIHDPLAQMIIVVVSGPDRPVRMPFGRPCGEYLTEGWQNRYPCAVASPIN